MEAQKRIRHSRHKVELFDTLKAMVNNPEYSDVVFACKDGERVHSSRMFLVARSPFFKTMIKNGWAESKQAEISLPEISSQPLLSILNFLYTGEMFNDEQQPSWMDAFEVLVAAKFLLLKDPVEIVWDCLEDMTRKIPEPPGDEGLIEAAERLSVAVRYRNVWNDNNSVPRMLHEILSKRPLEPPHLSCLSMDALQYFLLDPDAKKDIQTKSLSFQEYLKLRYVILWCISQVVPEEAVGVSISHMPGPYLALKLLEEPSSPRINASDYVKTLLSRFGSSEILLSMIDLRLIHPELLVKVVEPLDVFPLSKIIEVYRIHLVERRPRQVTFLKPHKLWEHDHFYRTVEDGSVLETLGYGVDAFARYTIPLCRSYGIYEWDVISVTQEFKDNWWPCIGVVHEKDLPLVTKNLYQVGWVFTSHKTGQYCVNRRDDNNIWAWRDYGGKVSSCRISSVRVHLDMHQRSCWFSYEGQTFEEGSSGLAFENMPPGVYFPAVTLKAGHKIRIKLVRGFDIS